MLFETKKIPLKDGRTAVLRAPEVSDARELLEYLKITAEETPFLLRTPEECNLTLKQEKQWIESTRNSPDDMTIICTVDGRLAGNCSLTRMNKSKTRHRAVVGIALMKPWWGLGIGTAMFEEMLRMGTQWGLEQLELEVMEGNTAAIGLYEKMGFQLVATRPRAFRLADGTYRDEHMMVRQL